MERTVLPQGGQACVGGDGQQWGTLGLEPLTPDMALPCGQACPLSCVLSLP